MGFLTLEMMLFSAPAKRKSAISGASIFDDLVLLQSIGELWLKLDLSLASSKP